ncbi:MAG TPA: FAD-linked oxidase C-terminal domain-containing protein [Gammaproteobacteria bacterium]|nr:FAD-linked oxidase C-terminal domain-containing protein [Gammaproteobacteria bacterium]
MHEQTFIGLLQNQLPAHCVLTHPDELRPYECDALSAYRQLPLVVVIPETLPQLQATVRLCAQHKVPVVARGSGTGLSGGAMPLGNGVLLSLARFNRILEIDILNRIARVQPGVTNLAISGAVASHGLYYAPDPSSQIACSIGGNVAENAGGVHCLKYGLTTHNIQALKILTIDGETLSIGGPALDSPGYDLLALLTGSEGLLGIIYEVTVKLLPKPATAQVVLAAFESVDAAGAAVTATIASGIIPAGLELLDKPAIHAVRKFIDTGYPEDASAILLCELDGSSEDVMAQIERVSQVYRDAGATSLQVSRDEAERQRFWAGRKAAFPAMGRLSPDYYCMDGTIPRKHLAAVLNRITELSDEYGLPICNVFHAGDGNLHPLILYDANKAGELERTEELGGKILELCVAVGGTITGEHGVGLEKINQMCVQFNTAELQQFHAVKQAFDPEALLNPGKAIPTLHRCAEFGAMHVHHGQLPHPELERF